MEFFCAKCQRRHDVSRISADMFTICRDAIRDGIQNVTSSLEETSEVQNGSYLREALPNLREELLKFINLDNNSEEGMIQVKTPDFTGDARINAFFALDRKTMLATPGAIRDGLTVVLEYKVTLGQIYQLYKQYAPNKDYDAYWLFQDCEKEKFMEENVCQQTVYGLFDKNGVLTKVTGIGDDPFEDPNTKEKLGFIRICPHCGRELSRAAGFGEEIVVALAGSPRAGKTSCMVAMISALRKTQSKTDIELITDSNDRRWRALLDEIQLYDQCMKITKTPNDQKEVPALSLLIQMHNTKKVVTIVDMPGEFWQGGAGLTADFFRQYAGLYENIDCIWYVISKATIRMSQVDEHEERVIEKLLTEASEDKVHIQNANPEKLRENMTLLSDHMTAKNRPMPPTLVIVSKPDFFIDDADREETYKYHLLPERNVAQCNVDELTAILRSKRTKTIGVNEKDLWKHADNVRRFIFATNRAFLTAIERNCPDRFYVSLSPYGRPALEKKDDKITIKPVPYHEMFPLLWTLAINKGIPIHHKVKVTKRFLGKLINTEDREQDVLFEESERTIEMPEHSSKKERKTLEDQQKINDDICNNLLLSGKKQGRDFNTTTL